MDGQPVIMWFRRDLRLADNSALSAAAKSRKPVLALYVFDDVSPGKHAMGAAQRWWLHRSLTALAAELGAFDITLILRKGIASDVLGQVADECGAGALFSPETTTHGPALLKPACLRRYAFPSTRMMANCCLHLMAYVLGRENPIKSSRRFRNAAGPHRNRQLASKDQGI
jgi:hypothetical protein